MLQQEKPQDFVIGTGKTQSVKECVRLAFEAAGLNWEKYVETDKSLIRPAEVDVLCADPTRANQILGWQPKVSFSEMMKIMVEADLAIEKKQ